jgi:hypothetical protein
MPKFANARASLHRGMVEEGREGEEELEGILFSFFPLVQEEDDV